MLEELKKCKVCPHKCSINRLEGKKGICSSSDKVEISLASLHFYEEPCISGKNGSGTIFFTHCNLSCKYCQNYEISQQGRGKQITIEHLADIFLKQQEKGAENINLVTPTMYIYQIIEAIKIAKSKGLIIPIVYNTNSYETVESLKRLEGYVDIYLPDLKYYYDDIAKKYSNVNNYFEIATKAILEMYRQVGKPVIEKNGIMKKGIMIRHLILPNYVQNSKNIIKWINDNMKDKAFISIMAQYFPTYLAKEDEFINRKVNKKEYKQIEEYIYELNIENGYIQELGEHEEEFVPNFDLSE